jgi:hypothetical protein
LPFRNDEGQLQPLTALVCQRMVTVMSPDIAYPLTSFWGGIL